MKSGLIIGLGDVLRGDEGVGCYVLEELAQEPVRPSVRFLYLGDDPRCAGGWVCAADMVIIIGAFPLGGPPGRIHTWSYEVFRQHMAWMADEYQLIRFLVQALSRVDLAGRLPKDISFLWIEPYRTEGVGMSNRMRKPMWKAIYRIKQRLSSSGLLPQKALTISPILRIEPLDAAG